MSILVAYARKHGATQEIPERIADTLRVRGPQAGAHPVQQAGAPADHDGFVVVGAAHSTHWLNDAAAFVRDNQEMTRLDATHEKTDS